MNNQVMPVLDFSHRQGEMYALLERQVGLYTMGESSSLPVEMVQELMHSIRFTIETHLALSGKSAESDSLEALFREGGKDIWRQVEEAKALYSAVKRTASPLEHVAYGDTLRAIGGFFSAYDLQFFAHDIPCMIDYPLSLPVSESLEGIQFIKEYLRRLLLENRFCQCFGPEESIQLLHRFHPIYEDLIINLFEPILYTALGLALQKKELAPLLLQREDGEQLYHQFHPWREAEAKQLLREGQKRILIHFQLWDSDMRNYLTKVTQQQLSLLRTSSMAGYKNLFCIP